MRILEKLRNHSFWFIDYLKGNKIKNHYNDIKFILENYSLPESEQKRDTYLKNILNHAVNTTKFYKKYKDFDSIEDFPITDKNTIRDNIDKFKSTTFLNKNNHEISTSGSTGAPFQVFHNHNKRLRHNADTIYFGEKTGFSFGQKLIYIKLWPKNKSKSWVYNIDKQSVFALEDQDIKELLDGLKNNKSRKAMLGYASSFEKICNYLDRTDTTLINCNINSIISMSERLNDYTKKSIKKYFKQTIVSRYSNMEQGMIAQEENKNEGCFKINFASFVVEIIDIDKDEPIKNGNYGRVVVTDLFNYAVPLIRYDTGDIAKIEQFRNENGYIEPFLTNIEGRKMDLIYNTKGKLVPSHISYKMVKYGDFKQFQFIQHGKKEYIIKLNTDKKVKKEEELIEEYKAFLGVDATIRIVYVEGIPLLASGKKKEVMNTYKNSI